MFSAPTMAEIYKWRDAQGVTHYSEDPPTQAAQQASEISADLPPIQRVSKPPKAFPTSATKAQKKPKVTRRKASKRASKCPAYRAKIQRINQQLRGGYKEPTGNRLRAKRRELSDKIYAECG